MLSDLLLINNECTVYCLQGHTSTCQYRREECPNEGCGTHVALANMLDHVSSCGYRSVLCSVCYQPVAVRALQVRHCSLPSADCLSVKSTVYVAVASSRELHTFACDLPCRWVHGDHP